MCNITCLECKKEFNYEESRNAYASLTKHLKKEHGMSQLEYALKYIESSHPLCACGCGKKVKFKKWKFDKYYSDHKNKMKTESVVIEKMRNSLLSRTKVRYQDIGLTKEDLFESFELYKTEEYNSDNLSKKYGVDYRVLKKYWILVGVAKESAINRYARMHKSTWSNKGQKNGQHQSIDEEILNDAYNFLKKSDKKLTFTYLREIFGIKNSNSVLKKRMYEKFGKENISQYMLLGCRSHAEINFGYVLKYYFGEKNIKQQFLLKRKIYDFLLFDKLIIEYDGEYWHNRDDVINNDMEKDKIAVDNGYIIYRVAFRKSHDINILLEIQKILKNLGVEDEI